MDNDLARCSGGYVPISEFNKNELKVSQAIYNITLNGATENEFLERVKNNLSSLEVDLIELGSSDPFIIHRVLNTLICENLVVKGEKISDKQELIFIDRYKYHSIFDALN